MYFDHLTIREGLPHNAVYCLLQDQYGYIWIGGHNGLSRYDGYGFEVYRSSGQEDENSGFAGKSISSLFEDSQGNLWVGTRKSGINLRKKSTDRFVNLQSDSAFYPIRNHDISSFFEDKTGNIWITTVGAGVLKYDLKSGTSRIYTAENSGLSSNLAFDVVEDKYGTIWVAAAGGGLNFLKGQGQFELSHQMLPNHPNMGGYRKKLFLDDEYLWVGTEGTGLYRMNLSDRSYVHFAPGNGDRAISSYVVRDIFKTKDGRLFIATDGEGLNVFDETTGKISIHTYRVGENYALNSNALFCFLGDRTGNVWIGTYNGGINIYKPDKTWFEFFTPAIRKNDELQHRSILSVVQSHDGKIWVGTDGGGLNWLVDDNSHFSTPSFKHDPANPASIAGNVVKTIFEDSQRNLWLGIFGHGLDRFDPKTKLFQHIPIGSNNVWSIAERKDGKLWVATMGDGIRVLDPKTRQYTVLQPNLIDPNSLADVHIMTVFVDRDDQVWIGTADNGLDRWDEANRRFVHYRHNPQDSFSLSNDEVRAIFQDSKGEIWIGTEGGGLNHWLGEGRFERITGKDGSVINGVMGITEDNAGMIWITTFDAVYRFDPVTKALQGFDFRTWQNTNQFNQAAILSAQNGKLFFGGINGLNAIWPEQFRERDRQPEIVFTGIRIFNKRVPFGKLPDGRTILNRPIEQAEVIQLSYLDQSFSIEFAAMDFTNPLENEFSYKMEGFDEQWRTTSTGEHSASYTNLYPGNYIFKVRHRGKEASIKVNIRPPFWQTLWFRLLLVVFFAGLIASGVLFVIKRKEAAHRQQLLRLQNEKLAAEIEAKNSRLMFSAVQMAHKNEILTDVKKDLETMENEPAGKLRQLVRKLDQELMSEDYWEEFNVYFNQVDQYFIQSILEKHPELTQNDLRMCALIRINLTTKEIASLLNISSRGVEQGRYRLKKRLKLGNDDDLSKYITMFNREQ